MQFELSRLRMLDPTLPSAFGLATLDAARKCIIADRKNLLHFLVADGMRSVLDILECANASARPLALTMLAGTSVWASVHGLHYPEFAAASCCTFLDLFRHKWRPARGTKLSCLNIQLLEVTIGCIGSGHIALTTVLPVYPPPHLLLSLLPIHNLGPLSCAEMLRLKSAHSFFEDWRSSRNEQTAVHLLLDLWRGEEALRGMTDPQGVICNTARPLAGERLIGF